MNRGPFDPATTACRDMIDAIRQIIGKDPLYKGSGDPTDAERFWQPSYSSGRDRAPRHPTE